MQLTVRGQNFTGDKTIIMGILNVTPDSFSDGGRFFEEKSAVEQALKLASDGADIIDIGGESSRPGAARVSAEEELERVIPVIRGIRKQDSGIILSVDTYKSGVAETTLKEGADMINDISAGTLDEGMFDTAARAACPYVMMHMQGTPGDMQANPRYSAAGAAADIIDYFRARTGAALGAGIKRENIILDPGIGFGKTLEDNFEILGELPRLAALGFPVLAGVSRKSMIGRVLDRPPEGRLYGSIAAAVYSAVKGAAIVRVHDVKETKEALAMTDALIRHNSKQTVG